MVVEDTRERGPDPFDRSRTMAFTCHGCADCCRGSAIILSPFDLMRLAARSGEAPRAIVKERCVVLKHPQTNLPALMLETIPQCSFLDGENRCTVYRDRPLVCRGYPLGILTDLNQPGWRSGLLKFSIRANACPAPKGSWPLPIVRTLHEMATGAGVEAYAEAYRAWARLNWDVATESRYPTMAIGEALAFDAEFVRTFYEEVETPPDEGNALIAFIERVRAFRKRHGLTRAPASEVSTPPAATSA